LTNPVLTRQVVRKSKCGGFEMSITYAVNEEKNGIEIRFPDTEKPSQNIREQLTLNKFRFSRRGFWYTKNTPERLEFAKSLANEEVEVEPVEYPEIDIDDIESYVIDQTLQDREHDSAWVFRRNKKDHNKIIQEYFEDFNKKVVELLENSDDEASVYYLKKSLQRFKKKYFENYESILRHNANNPSWAVTGRSGLNVNRYNKAMDRKDKLMRESIEIVEKFEDALDRARMNIRKEKVQKMREIVDKTEVDIEFKTQTKEFTFCGVKEKKRAYIYKDYWIVNTWGCFRIFKGDKLIRSLRTTDRLPVAKKTVALLLQADDVR
jgi:hypothetical protein